MFSDKDDVSAHLTRRNVPRETGRKPLEPSRLPHRLLRFWEIEKATGNAVIGLSRRRAGRFTVKTRPRTQRFDLGESGGPLQKGVTVWELVDAVVTRGDAIATMDTS